MTKDDLSRLASENTRQRSEIDTLRARLEEALTPQMVPVDGAVRLVIDGVDVEMTHYSRLGPMRGVDLDYSGPFPVVTGAGESIWHICARGPVRGLDAYFRRGSFENDADGKLVVRVSERLS